MKDRTLPIFKIKNTNNTKKSTLIFYLKINFMRLHLYTIKI